MRIVPLTALFHSTLKCRIYLLLISHFCEPYQEQQYVNHGKKRGGYFKSNVFWITYVVRYKFTQVFGILSLSYSGTVRFNINHGWFPVPTILIHIVLLALNMALYYVANFTHITRNSWNARIDGVSICFIVSKARENTFLANLYLM